MGLRIFFPRNIHRLQVKNIWLTAKQNTKNTKRLRGFWSLVVKKRNSDIELNLPWNKMGSLSRCINCYSSLQKNECFIKIEIWLSSNQTAECRQPILIINIPKWTETQCADEFNSWWFWGNSSKSEKQLLEGCTSRNSWESAVSLGLEALGCS